MVETNKDNKAINLAFGKDIRDIKRKTKIPVSELTREQLLYRRNNILDQLAEMEESLHYARQDVAQYFSSLNIQNPEKRLEAERALAEMVREFEMLKRELSELNAH
jgi:hypothetical protein